MGGGGGVKFGRRTVTWSNQKIESSSLPLSVLFCHRFHPPVLFFILFPCSDVGLYDPHVVTRGRIDGRNARVRSSPLVPAAERPQWGHMSKQLAHRCIEFTEENGGGRSKESWCCVIGAPPWARSSSTGRSSRRRAALQSKLFVPREERRRIRVDGSCCGWYGRENESW